MSRPTLEKVLTFFLTKIIIGILVIGGSVALVEWAGRLLLEKIQLAEAIKNLIIALAEAGISLYAYIILFSRYEKRPISELSRAGFVKYSATGFATGLVLQSLFILVIYIIGTYTIEKINPVNYLLPSFTTALTAGFVTELIFRGILFRIIEEKFGSVLAMTFMTLLFVVFHLNVEGATPISVLSTAMASGLLLSSVYILTRSLWFPIFLHFGWDFAEPGVFGAINPGNSIEQSLFSGRISGPELITGGQLGPQNSIQALIIITLTCVVVLWVAKRAKGAQGTEHSRQIDAPDALE